MFSYCIELNCITTAIDIYSLGMVTLEVYESTRRR
jgi:hypothetical protein